MRWPIITLGALLIFSLEASSAQDSDKIDNAIEWMKEACVTGKKLDIEAKAAGEVSVIKKGVGGSLSLSVREARGAVDILNDELKSEDNNDIRECMKPHIGTILKAILGNAVFVHQKAVIELESLKITPDGALMAAVAYTNLTRDPFEITLDYPPKAKAFAVDDVGNEYALEKSTGMERRYNNPYSDLIAPQQAWLSSTYLLMPPGEKVGAGFLLKRQTSRRQTAQFDAEKPHSVTLSIGHFARPTTNFDPRKPQGVFGLSATFPDVPTD